MKTAAPIPFAGSQLNETCHVCGFSSGDEEEYRVLLPFIKGGIPYGDKAVHHVSPEQRQDHLATVGLQRESKRQRPSRTANSSVGPIPKYLRDGMDCTFRRVHRPP
jgi:hypothetical protein